MLKPQISRTIADSTAHSVKSAACQLSLIRGAFIAGAEAEVEIFLIVVLYFNHHCLLAELLVPGGDFVIARRKLQLVRSTLFRNGIERVIENPDERAHPLMNVASNRYRHFRHREFR